jgi:hypothetical protein
MRLFNKSKLFLFTFCFLYTSVLSAQTLTNGQVYDYNIGDVFHISISSPSYGASIHDTIIGKSYSIANDTVFYQVSRSQASSSNPNITYSTIILSYTNLNSTASHYYINQCSTSPPPSDSTFYSNEYCNQLTWRRTSNTDTGCFEDNYYESELIEGAGGPYFDVDVGIGGPGYSSYKLVYFKNGLTGCTTSINSFKNLDFKIKLYPNPTSNYLTIETNLDFKKYMITQITGQLVDENLFDNFINVSTLKKGIYYLILFKEDNTSIPIKFIKN